MEMSTSPTDLARKSTSLTDLDKKFTTNQYQKNLFYSFLNFLLEILKSVFAVAIKEKEREWMNLRTGNNKKSLIVIKMM